MKGILTAVLILISATAFAKTEDTIPAGTYNLDLSHASLIFRVNHLGLSKYTARFKNFDATLEFNQKNPVASSVTATIYPTSLETDYPNFFPDFNAVLQNKPWLNAIDFPEITFQSTAVKLTGVKKALVTGNLTINGISHPVTMNTTFNGGYASTPFDSGSRVGFSANGSLKRSAFGITEAIPEAGSNIGVSDDVEFIIEAEFTKELNS